MRTLGKLLLTSAFLLPACADDDPDPDAVAGWRAASTALGSQGAQWKAEADADGELDTDLVCPSGGQYVVEGNIADANEFDVSVTFEGCNADGVLISGHLSMHAEVELTENSSRVHVDYQGELSFTGEAEATCEIDVVADVVVETTGGNDPSAHVEASFHGEICGYSAAAVVDASHG
ncbi:MAG: hypothetical protein IAG13_23685 [Deltaproteobacteria bacterium]|nr:hypothetical protein [Nannocystaceae bacterium]